MNNNYYQVIDGTTMYYPEYVEQLQEENKELKEQLKIKHDGFMSSVDECCEYATILEEFEKWLEGQHYDIATQDVLDKLKKMKGNNNDSYK